MFFKKIAEVEAVARQLPGPKIVSIVDGNETTALTTAQLQDMGFAVVLYAVTALFSATLAVERALATLRATGTPRDVPTLSYADFTRVVGLEPHQRLDEHYGAEV